MKIQRKKNLFVLLWNIQMILLICIPTYIYIYIYSYIHRYERKKKVQANTIKRLPLLRYDPSQRCWEKKHRERMLRISSTLLSSFIKLQITQRHNASLKLLWRFFTFSNLSSSIQTSSTLCLERRKERKEKRIFYCKKRS